MLRLIYHITIILISEVIFTISNGNRGFHMSDHVLLDLFNKLRKRDKM